MVGGGGGVCVCVCGWVGWLGMCGCVFVGVGNFRTYNGPLQPVYYWSSCHCIVSLVM